jgi:uncharacterized protein (DUF433 family)
MGEPALVTQIDLVTKTAAICGGDACIRGHRIPVWVLVDFRRHTASDAEVQRAYPSLTADDLKAAWNYAATNACV